MDSITHILSALTKTCSELRNPRAQVGQLTQQLLSEVSHNPQAEPLVKTLISLRFEPHNEPNVNQLYQKLAEVYNSLARTDAGSQAIDTNAPHLPLGIETNGTKLQNEAAFACAFNTPRAGFNPSSSFESLDLGPAPVSYASPLVHPIAHTSYDDTNNINININNNNNNSNSSSSSSNDESPELQSLCTSFSEDLGRFPPHTPFQNTPDLGELTDQLLRGTSLSSDPTLSHPLESYFCWPETATSSQSRTTDSTISSPNLSPDTFKTEDLSAHPTIKNEVDTNDFTESLFSDHIPTNNNADHIHHHPYHHHHHHPHHHPPPSHSHPHPHFGYPFQSGSFIGQGFTASSSFQSQDFASFPQSRQRSVSVGSSLPPAHFATGDILSFPLNESPTLVSSLVSPSVKPLSSSIRNSPNSRLSSPTISRPTSPLEKPHVVFKQSPPTPPLSKSIPESKSISNKINKKNNDNNNSNNINNHCTSNGNDRNFLCQHLRKGAGNPLAANSNLVDLSQIEYYDLRDESGKSFRKCENHSTVVIKPKERGPKLLQLWRESCSKCLPLTSGEITGPIFVIKIKGQQEQTFPIDWNSYKPNKLK